MSNKAVFLDRDDTLVNDPGYINNPDQVELLPGAAQAIVQLRKMGYKTIIVSNQSGVARGIFTEKVLAKINQRLRDLLAKENAYIDAIYYCPYHPDGVIPDYRKESDMRKPNPGMLLQAARELDIDMENSWMIGDSYRDTTAGKKAGCKTILIKSPARPPVKKPTDPQPDHIAVNVKEAANIIRMVYNQNKSAVTTYQPSPQLAVTLPDAEQPATPVQPKEQITGAELPKSNKPPAILRTVKPKQKQHTAKTPADTDHTNTLLRELLDHMRRNKRDDMFEEFSIYKMLATVTQVLVFFCLILSLWFLMDSSRSADAVHTTIGYAIVIQLMVVACCIMERKK